MPDYYHYTSPAGMRGIESSRTINESVSPDAGDDARFGRGVYLTTIAPSEGKEKIITRCWGRNQFPAFMNNGRVDYAIRVTLPDNCNRLKRTLKNTDVFLYKSQLKLDDYTWVIIKVPHKC